MGLPIDAAGKRQSRDIDRSEQSFHARSFDCHQKPINCSHDGGKCSTNRLRVGSKSQASISTTRTARIGAVYTHNNRSLVIEEWHAETPPLSQFQMSTDSMEMA